MILALVCPGIGWAEDKGIVGRPVTIKQVATLTVEQIMERDRLLPPPLLRSPRPVEQELESELEQVEDRDAPPPLSHWPPIPDAPWGMLVPVEPALPQTVGTSFKALDYPESGGWLPPDSMGDVGPTQVLIHVNGRVKVFDKAGNPGPLNADTYAFWGPLLGTNYPGDPQVRYDRLSGRWFIQSTDFPSANNQIMLAVSSGPTITATSSFTFYSIRLGIVLPSDAPYWCDYDSLGIDAQALYIGCNIFDVSRGYQYSSAFVVQKSSVTSGGPMLVTGFSAIAAAGVAGPFAPRGVDNDDPSWNEGYFIGTDPTTPTRINIRRISNPGGTPVLGANVILPISGTTLLDQLVRGAGTPLATVSMRLFAASIHKNKITGVTSLWTAHSVETDATCTPSAAGGFRRLGAKWYEIGELTTTPTITQFGTLCTTTAGGAQDNSQRGFPFPTVAISGQGHMAMAASFASTTEYAGIAAAGRIRTDPLGGTRAPATIVQTGLDAYQRLDNSARNRWGDYSFTDVDPNDDQTIWTVQEYADTPADTWAVRVVQLKAPPPPNPISSSNPVCVGVAAAPVSIHAADSCAAPTCTNGLCTGGGGCPEFFDPGPDTGGPGYANHIGATVTGGIVVNSASIVIPANPASQRVLDVALSLDTRGTTTGTKSVTITNPDGQSRTGTNIISVIPNRNPVARTGGPYSACQGGAVLFDGTTSTDPDASCGDGLALYEWDLNNDGTFDVTGATPSVSGAQLSALGLVAGANTIKLRVTDSHSATNVGSGTLTLIADGGGCNDANACTPIGACQSGSCTGSNPVVCIALDQCHAVGTCDTVTGICSNPERPDGTSCNDADGTSCGDACTGGVCSGHAVDAPAEIDGSVLMSKTPSDTTISWTDNPGPYAVYRGANGPGGTPWAYNHSCLAPGLAVTSTVDSDVPAPETFFYYLVTRYNECRESVPGSDGQANTIPNASPCPAP